MKKKSKGNAKPKAKAKTQPPKPREKPSVETARWLTLLGGPVALISLRKSVKSFEENTGAKANQTRLIDFVRWCEDNSGLL